jgi:hypothetical protein
MHVCGYDGTDCSYSVVPFRNCSAIAQGIDCERLFNNGICDRACNSEECLYDGRDCLQPVPKCNPMYDSYCSHHYTDNHCDRGCNNAECGWDGLDCDVDAAEVERNVADGTLVFIVLVPPSEFRKVASRFLRQVGLLLHSVPKISFDDRGDQMIYPWYGRNGSSAGGGGRVVSLGPSNASRVRRMAESPATGYELRLSREFIQYLVSQRADTGIVFSSAHAGS